MQDFEIKHPDVVRAWTVRHGLHETLYVGTTIDLSPLIPDPEGSTKMVPNLRWRALDEAVHAVSGKRDVVFQTVPVATSPAPVSAEEAAPS